MESYMRDARTVAAQGSSTSETIIPSERVGVVGVVVCGRGCVWLCVVMGGAQAMTWL